MAGGLWLLFECESRGGPSHAQPGDGRAARRWKVWAENQNAAVQRIWGCGGTLYGDGSAEELLTPRADRKVGGRSEALAPRDTNCNEEILVEQMDQGLALLVLPGSVSGFT